MNKRFLVAVIFTALSTLPTKSDEIKNLKKGNEYIYSSFDAITEKSFRLTTVVVTEKTDAEVTIRWGDSMHEYNDYLRAKKRGFWTYSPFGCDGLAKQMSSGFSETYRYEGVFEKGTEKSQAVGTCVIRVGEEKEFTVNNKTLKARYVENIRTYHFKSNPQRKRLYIQNAYFAEEIGFWIEGEWIEKHDNKLFSHTKFKLERFAER